MPTTYDVREMTPSGHIDERGVRFYTRKFQVTTSNPLDGPAAVARHVPYSLYESYPFPGEEDPHAILKSVRPEPTDTLGVWTVTLEYDSAPNNVDRGTARPERPDQAPRSPGTANNQQTPEDRPWVVKWGSVKTTKPLRRDRSGPGADPEVKGFLGEARAGVLVATSAGQLYDPTIEVPEDNPTVSITAFGTLGNSGNVRYWVNRVNHARWLGWPRDCGRVTHYGITSVYEQGRFFYQIDVVVEFKRDGWNPVRVLDAGTFAKTDPHGNGLKFQAILNARDGTPVTTPVPLDGFGAPLENGKELVFNEFQGYHRGNFRALLRQDLGARRRPRE